MSGGRVLVRAQDITKTFRSGSIEAEALNGISLELRAGELALLMGPSGSGKTTLLYILSGLLRPTSGSVELCGVPITQLPEKASGEVRRAHVGFVFQTYNLFPALSALDNVAEVLVMKGAPRAQARARWRRAAVARPRARPGDVSDDRRGRPA